jgi:5-carboxymethyl-2-hydroxymuconate isomerase
VGPASDVSIQGCSQLKLVKQVKESILNNMDGLFDFENDDDITVEDYERLENEAWEKAEVLGKNSGDKKANNNVACLDLTKDRNTTTLNSTASNEARSNPRTSQIQTGPKQQVADEFQVNYFNKQFQGTQMQQLANQLEEYKLKVEELENSLCMKDGQLKVVKQNLDARRREVTEKVNTIVQIRKEQAEERSERNCKLSQEVRKLKTQLSFQKHELMKLETHKIQSQKVSNSQNVSNNDQNVSYSQKVSGSVKRKAEVATTSHGFDLDNSFHDSQMSGCKVPQGKVPRLEETNDHGKVENVCGRQPKSRERKTSLTCRASTSNMDKPTETKSLTLCKTNKSSLAKPNTVMTLVKPRETTKPRQTSVEYPGSNNQLLEPKIVTVCEKKVCNLVKKLVLSHTCDSSLNDGSPDFETMSLLTLLKYPLKHLPEVLKAHSVDANADQSLSQFPIWQTRAADSSDLATDEELDFDSGKYNLVSQAIFLLLGLSNLTEKNVDTLGVIHVLVFLELYITSYLLTRQRTDERDSKAEARNLCQEGSTHGDSTSESEAQKTSFDEQEMILQTLQILKLLFYSTPDLVKCILDRTSPALFKEDDEVIVVYDSKKAKTKKGLEEDENVQGNLVLLFEKDWTTTVSVTHKINLLKCKTQSP